MKTCHLVSKPKPLADTLAQEDVKLRHIAKQDIENKQNAFRAASFLLSAGKKHPPGSEIFQIREIYLFKFTSKEEPLPKALERLKQAMDSQKFVLFFAKRFSRLKPLIERLEAFLKLVTNALGLEGKIAIIMIKFMIPEQIDACYEIKNSESVHGLYWFNGSGNKLSSGVLDLLGLMAESIAAMKGVVKALKTIAGLPKSAQTAILTIEKFITDFHADAVDFAKTFGPGFADLVDTLLTIMENGVITKAMLAPSSEFVAFKFHDGTAKHKVAELAGPARRNVIGAGFKEVVDIEFGGFVPNNFRDFQAEAKIKRLVLELLEVETVKRGSFTLLKGNYGFDLIVGPTDVVRD